MTPTLKPAITFAEKKDLDPAKLVRLYQQAPWAKGRTLEDAREMARDAIRCYLESALKTGEPIPGDVAEITTERVAVTIL